MGFIRVLEGRDFYERCILIRLGYHTRSKLIIRCISKKLILKLALILRISKKPVPKVCGNGFERIDEEM